MADAMFGFCKSNSNIPISHLDYVYIRKCNDAKELECLLKILRSGDEGHFPDLIQFTEKRLESVSPKSKLLQKETKVQLISELQNDESKQLLGDLQEWSNTIRGVDKGLVDDNNKLDSSLEYPPIRQLDKEETHPSKQNGFKQNDTNPKKNTKKGVAPRSYNEWAKFDIESEAKKVDEVINDKQSDVTRIHNKTNPLPTKVEIPKGLPDEEKAKKATHEKEKGNEAFIAGDFKEALAYYDRSISLCKSAAVFNNRAITNIKMEKFEDAIFDCETVLMLEPKNVKAFLRRGVALKHLKRYEGALQDFSLVLELAPSNKRARDLYEEVKKLVNETERGQKDDRNNENADPGVGPQGNESRKEQNDRAQENRAKKKGKRLKIIEIENTDDILKEKPTDLGTNEETTQIGEVKSRDSNYTKRAGEDTDEFLLANKKDENDTLSEISPDSVQSENRPSELDKRERDLQNSKEIEPEFSEESACREISKSAESLNSTIVKDGVTASREKIEPITPVPDDIIEMKDQGNAFYKSGRYAEAESKYSEAISKLKEGGGGHEQSIAVLLSNRAACKLKTGDCKGCVKDCTESLEMRPTAKAFLRRAESYELLENFRYAYADNQSALNFDNTLKAAWSATSRLSVLLKKRDGPKWREHLPKSESSSNLLKYEAGNLNYSRHEYSVSKRGDIEHGKNINPTDVKVEARQEPGESKNGLQGMKTGSEVKVTEGKVEQDEERFKRVKELGNKHVQNREYEDAIRCYSECIKLFPDEVTCYTNRSLCYLKLNQFDNVEIDASTALAIQVDNVKALYRRALARKGLGKYEEAVKDLTDLLEIDKSNSAARKEVAMIREMMNKSSSNNINAEEHAVAKDSLGNIKNDIGEDGAKVEPSKNEEMKRKHLDQRERGNGGRIDETKEEKKKGKKLKIIEVESYDEIENVGRRHDSDSVETTGNERKEETKDNNDDIDRKINMEEEKSDTKTNLNWREKERNGKIPYEEGLPDEIIKMADDGDELFKNGRYADANESYTTALNAIGTGDKTYVASTAILYSKRAACKSKLGDLNSSIADASNSLKLKPSVDSYLMRARSYDELERYGNAYVDYMAALRLDSSIKFAFNACSRLTKVLLERDGEKWREKLPKEDKSLDQIKRVDAVNVVKEERNDKERRKDDEEQTENEKPRFKRVESMKERFDRIKELGNKCVQEGKYQDATSYYSQCIDFDANEPISYVNRALCYLKLNKPKKAEHDCTKALGFQANNIKALFRRALARKAIGKYKESLQDLTTLLKLDPKNATAQKELDAIKELWREELKNISRKQSEKGMESSSAAHQKSKKKKSQQTENQKNLAASETAPLKASPMQRSQVETSEQRTLKETVQRPTRKLNLKKASGFEFLKAWNELKGKGLQEYAHLLLQIEPSQLPKVISNKIDVEMILIIVSCVNEYFFTKDKLLAGFNILRYMSRSERFSMGLMFLSTTDLSKVRRVVEELVCKLTDSKLNVSAKDILELRKAYKTT